MRSYSLMTLQCRGCHLGDELQNDQQALETPMDSPGDPTLSMLLNLMERFRFSNDVTLTVGGLVVAGTVISAEEYFHHLAAQYESGWGRAAEFNASQGEEAKATFARVMGEQMSRALRDAGRSFRVPNPMAPPTAGNTGDESDDLFPPRKHITLKHVSIKGGTGFEFDAPLWRGRLVEVSGWSFGRYGVADYEDERLETPQFDPAPEPINA